MLETVTHSVQARLAALRAAGLELLSQEFSPSTGYVAAILNGCLFAPSLLSFWLVNGVLDFSTAVTIGAVATPAGLQLRLLGYLLLVPVFFALRASVHLLHPTHRRQLLAGSCPNARYLSLDWFSMGILATGLPVALQAFGPWAGANAVFLVGVFVLPQYLRADRAIASKRLAIGGGVALFLYAKYGGFVPYAPAPAQVLGPVATFQLTDGTTAWLLAVVNSLLVGPVVVAVVGILMNHVLTRPELTDLPLLSHAMPRRDPDRVVAASATLGTAFYLLVVAAATGRVALVP